MKNEKVIIFHFSYNKDLGYVECVGVVIYEFKDDQIFNVARYVSKTLICKRVIKRYVLKYSKLYLKDLDLFMQVNSYE